MRLIVHIFVVPRFILLNLVEVLLDVGVHRDPVLVVKYARVDGLARLALEEVNTSDVALLKDDRSQVSTTST